MPKNKMSDLRNHLFETLESLKDTETPLDVERAKAICQVSNVIIEWCAMNPNSSSLGKFDADKAFAFFAPNAVNQGVSYSNFYRAAKRAFLMEVLNRNHGNQSRAARDLGMHRNTLHREMHALGIPVRPEAKTDAEASAA